MRARLGFDEHEHVVHGKVYDLTAYLDSHPGGREWLVLTQGMDVTPLFESHHLLSDAKMQKLLQKFYVRDCHRSRTTPAPAADDVEAFSYLETGFYKTLKRRAAAVLERAAAAEQATGPRQARGPTTEMRVLVWAILGAWVGCLAWCCRAGAGYLPSVLAGILLNALVGVGHNGMHTAPTWWRFLMDLSMFSSREWRVSHALSHHHYPNSKVDFEIAAVEPFIYSLYSSQANSVLLPVYLWSVLCILGPFELVGRLLNVVVRRIQPPRWENALPFVELAVLMLVGQNGARVGWRQWLLMHVVASALLGLQALPLHHSDHSWSDGKPHTPPRPLDFGLHTMAATQDFSAELPLWAVLLVSPFNHHRLHHLLPAVDESRLPMLEGVLLQTCQEFGVPYVVHPWAELAMGTLRNWFDVGGHRRARAHAPLGGGGPKPKRQ